MVGGMGSAVGRRESVCRECVCQVQTSWADGRRLQIIDIIDYQFD